MKTMGKAMKTMGKMGKCCFLASLLDRSHRVLELASTSKGHELRKKMRFREQADVGKMDPQNGDVIEAIKSGCDKK